MYGLANTTSRYACVCVPRTIEVACRAMAHCAWVQVNASLPGEARGCTTVLPYSQPPLSPHACVCRSGAACSVNQASNPTHFVHHSANAFPSKSSVVLCHLRKWHPNFTRTRNSNVSMRLDRVTRAAPTNGHKCLLTLLNKVCRGACHV
jgi:hypothetical protein